RYLRPLFCRSNHGKISLGICKRTNFGVFMRTLKFAVLGHPIRHSLSPTLFSKFKSIFSLKEFSYEILNVEPQNLNFDLLSEYDGLNVTSPYKSQVLEFAKVKSQEVEILSAANVLKKTR